MWGMLGTVFLGKQPVEPGVSYVPGRLRAVKNPPMVTITTPEWN
jgi:hypothetical protein